MWFCETMNRCFRSWCNAQFRQKKKQVTFALIDLQFESVKMNSLWRGSLEAVVHHPHTTRQNWRSAFPGSKDQLSMISWSGRITWCCRIWEAFQTPRWYLPPPLHRPTRTPSNPPAMRFDQWLRWNLKLPYAYMIMIDAFDACMTETRTKIIFYTQRPNDQPRFQKALTLAASADFCNLFLAFFKLSMWGWISAKIADFTDALLGCEALLPPGGVGYWEVMLGVGWNCNALIPGIKTLYNAHCAVSPVWFRLFTLSWAWIEQSEVSHRLWIR